MFVKHLCPLPIHMRKGLTFDWLTWISIGINYSSRTIQLAASLNFSCKMSLGYRLHKVKNNDRHSYRPIYAKQYAPPSKGEGHTMQTNRRTLSIYNSEQTCNLALSMQRNTDSPWSYMHVYSKHVHLLALVKKFKIISTLHRNMKPLLKDSMAGLQSLFQNFNTEVN